MNAITPAVLQNAELLRDLCAEHLFGSLAEMARQLERDKSNFAKTIQRLEADGLVEHLPQAGELRITETGRRAIMGIDVADGRIGVPEGAALVRHELIFRDILNPREDFEGDSIASLADSIAERGLLQPILIRPAETVDWASVPVHRLVAGERRWRALRILIDDGRWPAERLVRCEIQPMNDEEHAVRAIVENEQRVDLNHVERGRAYERLATQYEKSNLAIAAMVNRTVEYVQQHRRLLRLDDQTLQWVAEGKLAFQEALRLVPTPQKANKAAAEGEALQLDIEGASAPEPNIEMVLDGDAEVSNGRERSDPGRLLPETKPTPLPVAEAQSGATHPAEVELTPKQRLILVECAHKIETAPITPDGRDYKGAKVGQYWLDAVARELVERRLITFANPGGGWLVTLTDQGEAVAYHHWSGKLSQIGEHILFGARDIAGQSAWARSDYVTPWLNPADHIAGVVAAQIAEADDELDAMQQAEATCGQVVAYAQELCDTVDRGGSYSVGGPARKLAQAIDRPLPWKLAENADDATIGVVFDANGEAVSVVDTDRTLADAQARAIALMIVLGANTFGGHRPLALPTEV